MFLDTSAIIEHFIGSKKGEKVTATLKKEPCIISVLSLAEAKIWCLRNNREYNVLAEKVNRMLSIAGLTKGICETGAEITYKMQKINKGFRLMDGLILASARSLGQKLMTGDSHFEGLGDVEFV